MKTIVSDQNQNVLPQFGWNGFQHYGMKMIQGIKNFIAHQQQMKEVRELKERYAQMDDHLLQDIGLTREELMKTLS